MITTDVTLDDAQIQIVLVALAELSLRRPGWNWPLCQIADKLQGREMFEDFKRTWSDRIEVDFTAPPPPAPSGPPPA